MECMSYFEAICDIPEGKFRVIGENKFEEKYFVVGDYNSRNDAIDVARRQHENERETFEKGEGLDAYFRVIDDGKLEIWCSESKAEEFEDIDLEEE